METLTQDQIDWVVVQVSKWANVASHRNRSHGGHYAVTPADVDHSALLRRLLAGQPFHPIPPPTSFSSPWYSLVETGQDTKCEVKLFGRVEMMDDGKGYTLMVNQNPGWILVHQESPDRLIITHPNTPGDLWFASRDPNVTHSMSWHIVRLDRRVNADGVDYR